MTKKNKNWEMKMSADGESGDIFIYGDIESYKFVDEDTTATSFKNDLDSLGDISDINLYINSPGGNVFEGLAIHNMLKRHKAKVTVNIDALAASISSVIAMAGDVIRMPSNSMMMIHNALAGILGNAEELRKMADDLERITNSTKETYLQKANGKLDEDKLTELMDAETWLSAREAVEYGLADEILEENQMVASIDNELFSKYKNVPKQLEEKEETAMTAKEKAERERIAEEASQKLKLLQIGGL